MSAPGFHGVPNEIVASWLIESIYAADRLSRDLCSPAITLPCAAYHEIPPAHVVDAASKRGLE
ncbi:MAG: hypothetical protein FJX25_02325 [Alphaproteobacteria bacterium]|nr:hypothetical protein [Alphaproteobacteria bacterium]